MTMDQTASAPATEWRPPKAPEPANIGAPEDIFALLPLLPEDLFLANESSLLQPQLSWLPLFLHKEVDFQLDAVASYLSPS